MINYNYITMSYDKQPDDECESTRLRLPRNLLKSWRPGELLKTHLPKWQTANEKHTVKSTNVINSFMNNLMKIRFTTKQTRLRPTPSLNVLTPFTHTVDLV